MTNYKVPLEYKVGENKYIINFYVKVKAGSNPPLHVSYILACNINVLND